MPDQPTIQLLIADDDASIRDLFERAYRRAFKLILAKDGDEALRVLSSTKPDAILVDEMMPGATGTEVLRAAKLMHPGVPRLLMTASSDPSAAVRAVNLGELHRFYNKPLRMMEVKDAIIELVERARAEQTLRAELVALHAQHSTVKATTTRVGMWCEGEAGHLIAAAAERRGFALKRCRRIDDLRVLLGAGSVDVVVVDAAAGHDVLLELNQLAHGVDVGLSLILVDQEGSIEGLRRAFEIGAADCLSPPWPEEVMLSVRLERAAARPRDRKSLRRRTYDLVIANRELALAKEKVAEGQVKLLNSLVRALEARDPYTAGHTDRVASISTRVGDAMAVGPALLETIRIGALLHDIGKIGIRDEVLMKPGRLTAEEYEVIKTHTVIGARILDGIESLACAVPIVRGHHERPDGKGYPDGKDITTLPLEVRIVSGADVLDAITSTRVYRAASQADEALNILDGLAGTQLDADVVSALRDLHREGRLADLLLQR